MTAEQIEAGAIVRLLQHWQASNDQACRILAISAGTWSGWKAGVIDAVSADQAARVSLLLGIHVGLQYLFVDRERGYRWASAPNTIFDGLTPLEIMSSGSIDGLLRVRSYLDAERA